MELGLDLCTNLTSLRIEFPLHEYPANVPVYRMTTAGTIWKWLHGCTFRNLQHLELQLRYSDLFTEKQTLIQDGSQLENLVPLISPRLAIHLQSLVISLRVSPRCRTLPHYSLKVDGVRRFCSLFGTFSDASVLKVDIGDKIEVID